MFARTNLEDFKTDVASVTELEALKGECAIVINKYCGKGFLTFHEIDNENQLKSGVFIGASEALKHLNQLNTDSKPVDGWVDPSVLYSTDNKLVWYSKAQTRDLWFKVSEHMKLTVKSPALVFVLNRKSRSLNVFCVKTKSRPTLDAKVYNAPFMNVDQLGGLCLGSAQLPDDLFGDSLELRSQCEATLFESNFTHVNNPNTFKSKGEVSNVSHISIWQKLAREGREPRASELVCTGRNLKAIVEGC